MENIATSCTEICSDIRNPQVHFTYYSSALIRIRLLIQKLLNHFYYTFEPVVCVCVCVCVCTHTPQVQNYAAKHRPSTRQNICEPLRVIPVKHSSVLPDDGSRKSRNMSE